MTRILSNRISFLKLAALAMPLALAACGGGPERPASRQMAEAPKDNILPKGDQGGYRKVGNPYKIGGTWYYPKEEPDYIEVGYASWYGPQFHGKKTANGETFNMNSLTAAHRTLPMPSFVKVTNLENKRSIILRVNDRGPFAKGRIIDISRRGAQMLGFEKQGVTKVRVQITDEYGKPLKGRKKTHSRPKYDTEIVADTLQENATESGVFVQVGSYQDKANARSQIRRLKEAGQKADLHKVNTSKGTFYRVRIGPLRDTWQAETVLANLLEKGFDMARIFGTGASR